MALMMVNCCSGTPPRRSESVRSGGSGGGGLGSVALGGVDGSAGYSGGGGRGPGQANSTRDMSLTCSSTDRLSEMWPSGEWTSAQQQQQQQRRRRASMQDALDFTKIDASLYERPVSDVILLSYMLSNNFCNGLSLSPQAIIDSHFGNVMLRQRDPPSPDTFICNVM